LLENKLLVVGWRKEANMKSDFSYPIQNPMLKREVPIGKISLTLLENSTISPTQIMSNT
jgi:hypothetical protein